MRVASGTVVAGKVVIDGEPLPEGATVTVVAPERDEAFELNAEEEQELLAAIAEADRGEFVDAEDKFHTFNMGFGWVVIVSPDDADKILSAGPGGVKIGTISDTAGVRVEMES